MGKQSVLSRQMQRLREIHDTKDRASRQTRQDKVGDWDNEPSYPESCSADDPFGQAPHMIKTPESCAALTDSAPCGDSPLATDEKLSGSWCPSLQNDLVFLACPSTRSSCYHQDLDHTS